MPRKKRIRVLYLNTSGVVGGAEISLMTLLSELKRYQFEATVACPPGEYVDRLKHCDLEVIPTKIELLKPIRLKFSKKRFYVVNPIACLYNVLLVLLNALRLHKIIRKIQPHILHANSLEAIGLIALPSLLSNTPMIWHMRTLLQENSPTEKFYVKCMSHFVKRIIAVSKAVRERLVASGADRNKIEVVYNPIDTYVFTPKSQSESRKKFNLPAHSLIIGSLGRLHKEKGYEVFLKAANIIRKEFQNVLFLIAGKEWKRHYRKKLSDLSHNLNLSQNLVLMDWQEDVHSLICALDILLLLPLTNEGFPRTLAEGMACEVAVIGSRIGGIKELIENNKNGLLVPPCDENAVAEAIDRLLKNRNLAARLAKQGRKTIETKFTVHRHLKKITKIYTQCIPNHLQH